MPLWVAPPPSGGGGGAGNIGRTGYVAGAGGTPQLIIQAIFDDAQFQNRMQAYMRALGQLLQIQQIIQQQSQQQLNRMRQNNRQSEVSIDQMVKRFRWQLVTLLYLFHTAARGIENAFERIQQSMEETEQIAGARVLGRMYDVNVGPVASALREVADQTLSVQESVSLAQRAMLHDHGYFVQEYARLWEAARRAAVVGGGEAEDIFESMVESLVAGTGAAVDSSTQLFDVEQALQEYAATVGQTVDSLGRLERAEVILRQIYEVSDQMGREGADAAMEHAEAVDELAASWSDFWRVISEIAKPSGFVKQLADGIDSLTVSVGFLGAAFRAATQDIATTAGLAAAFDPVNIAVAIGTKLADAIGIRLGLPGQELAPNFREELKKMTDAMGQFEDDVTGMGAGIPAALDDAWGKADFSGMVNHLMKREDILEDHADRMAEIEEDYQDRVDDIWNDYERNRDRLIRNYERRRNRLIRRHNDRRLEAREDLQKKLREMEERHELDMEHRRQRFRLNAINSEAMYLYERGLAVAEGDVLAIKDLDARYEIEKKSRQEAFDLEQRQAEENFQLRLKQARESYEEQRRDLQDNLDEQLRDLHENLQEQLREAQIRREEALAEAKKGYQRQIEAQQEHLSDSLEKWSDYWVELTQQTRLGSTDVVKMLYRYFGPGGEADRIITQYMQRHARWMREYRKLMGIVGDIQEESTPYPWVPIGQSKQFGGMHLLSSPRTFMAGESPEMVSFQPLTNLRAAMKVSWEGGPIPVHGTGSLSGGDMATLGDAIARGLLVSMSDALGGYAS